MSKLFTSRHLLVAVALIGVAIASHFGLIHPSGLDGMALIGIGATQLTPSLARVVDPILTTVAQGYRNADFVGSALFPYVPVQQRGGKIITFGKEDFLIYDTARAPGAATKRIQIGYSGSGFTLVDYSLEGTVPFEIMQEANAVPGIDLGRGSVMKVQNIIGLQLEKAQADLATTAGNYASANKNTSLASTTLWSDFTGSSHPIADVETGKEAIRAAIGRYPNTMTISAKVMKSLRQHPDIIDRIKYTGRDVPTPELLASLFGIPNVRVGAGIYTSGSSFADIWGKTVVLAYTELGSVADLGAPSYGYTYRLGGYPIVEVPYQDRNAKSWVYPVTDSNAPVIASAGAGYLISPAVA